MQYRPLGRSGLRVSPICHGTMMFALRTERAEAERIVGIARHAGINFVDTADVYSTGGSERMLGELIAADRDAWVVATKVGNPMGRGPNLGNHSRKWLMREIDASLDRLRTDHVDVWYLHVDDQATPLAETLGAIADIVRAGKVRYWGVSNFSAWRLAEACHVAREVGLAHGCEPPLWQRRQLLSRPSTCRLDFYGLGVVPTAPARRADRQVRR
jgi:aryl-alcohol dehydrogenase (NADP+)